MKRWIVPIVALALAIGFGMWWYSPKQVVKRRVASLLDTLTFEAGSSKPARKLGLYSLSGLLAESVDLETPSISEANGSFARQEMESAFSWLCDAARETRFDLIEIESLEVGGERAAVELTLEALVELPNHRPADGIYQVEFDWVDGENGWRLERAKWILTDGR